MTLKTSHGDRTAPGFDPHRLDVQAWTTNETIRLRFINPGTMLVVIGVDYDAQELLVKNRIRTVLLAGALFVAVAPLGNAMAQGHGSYGYGHGGYGYGHGYGHGYGRGYGPGPIGAIVGTAAAIVAAPFVLAGAIVQSVTPPPAYYPQGGNYYSAPGYGGGYYGRAAPSGYPSEAYPAANYGPPPGYGQPRGGYGYGVPPDYVPSQGQGYNGPRN